MRNRHVHNREFYTGKGGKKMKQYKGIYRGLALLLCLAMVISLQVTAIFASNSGGTAGIESPPCVGTILWQDAFTGSGISVTSSNPNKWQKAQPKNAVIVDPEDGNNKVAHLWAENVSGTKAVNTYIQKGFLNPESEIALSMRLYLPEKQAGSVQPALTVKFAGATLLTFTSGSDPTHVFSMTSGSDTSSIGKCKLADWVDVTLYVKSGTGSTPVERWANSTLKAYINGDLKDASGIGCQQIVAQRNVSVTYDSATWGTNTQALFAATMSVPAGSAAGFYLDDVVFYLPAEGVPTATPEPTVEPTAIPTIQPTIAPTTAPTLQPTVTPPVVIPTSQPGSEVPPHRNAALSKEVTVSSTLNAQRYPASSLTDNQYFAGLSKWMNTGGTGPHWAQIDLSAQTLIGSAAVYTGDNGAQICSDFELQYWNGATWATIPGAVISNNTEEFVPIVFSSPVETDKVRLYSNTENSFAIVELEVYESTNIALYKPATVSTVTSSSAGKNPQSAVDGSKVYSTSSWRSGTSGGEEWIALDLGDVYTLGRAGVYVGYDAPGVATPTQLKLQSSDNGLAWDDIPGAGVIDNAAGDLIFDLNNIQTRYVRLVRPAGAYTGNVKAFYVRELELYLSGGCEAVPVQAQPRGPIGRQCADTPAFDTPATHTATAVTLQAVLDSVADLPGTVVIETTGLPSVLTGGNAERTQNILIRPSLSSWLPDASTDLQASGVTLAGWNFTAFNHSYPSTRSWIWRCTISPQVQFTVRGAQGGGVCELVAPQRGENQDRFKVNPRTVNGIQYDTRNYQMIGMWLQGKDRTDGSSHSDTIQFSSGWDCVVRDSVLYHSHGQTIIVGSDVGTCGNLTIHNNWMGYDRAAVQEAIDRNDPVSARLAISTTWVVFTNNSINVKTNVNTDSGASSFAQASGNIMVNGFTQAQKDAFPNNLFEAGNYIVEEPALPDLHLIWD